MQNIEVEKLVKYSIYILYLLVPLVILFAWQIDFDYKLPIDSSRFGTFGDFVGGVFGAIWSLCGVIIFYKALKDQREDIEINRVALTKQVDALNMQIEEFKLQREEMSQSRQVFTEQSKTLKQQRMATTYFSLLEVYQKIVDSLNNRCPEKNYFHTFKKEFLEKYIAQDEYEDSREQASIIFSEIYHARKEDLSQYFKIVYRILRVVDKSDLEESEKFEFITIFRSQLGENEIFALYYNSHSTYGEMLYTYILRFNLLKHLSPLSKVELKPFQHDAVSTSKLSMISNDIAKVAQSCLDKLSSEIINDDFSEARASEYVSFDKNVLILAYSSELNEITIELLCSNLDERIEAISPSRNSLSKYLSWALYDAFVCSRYINRIKFTDFINCSSSVSSLKLFIRADFKLSLASDKDGELQ